MLKAIRQGFVCLVSVAAVAGCAAGSSSGVVGAQTVMVAAVSKSEAAATFHISAVEKMRSVSGTPFLSLDSVSMSGDVDLSTSSVHLKASLVGAPLTAGGTPQSMSFEVIQIGADSWDSTMGMGSFGSSVPPGHWTRDDSSSSSHVPDPAKWFDALRSAATTVRSLGAARVDGATCNEYRLTGTTSLFDALGSSDQSTVGGPVSIDVWVDRSNLVRRLSSTMEQNMGDPGQVESVALTVDFSDYGRPVRIEPPPANLVVPNA